MNQAPGKQHQPRGWLTAAEAAALLGVKRETLYAYASRGQLRSIDEVGSRRRLYARDDLERLRARSGARSGHGPVAAGALRWGEPVLETEVGTVDPRGPIYRGIPARDLVERGATFEEACALLWQEPFRLPARRTLGVRLARQAEASEPFESMLLATAHFAVDDPRAEHVQAMRARAPLLVRRLFATNARGAQAIQAAFDAGSAARSILLALGGRGSNTALAAVDATLVWTADHELNASTFAARVAASAGANLSSSVLAAMATVSGPLHGRETTRVEALLASVSAPERALGEITARIERGEPVPGFGHTLYPAGDPRGLELLTRAEAIAPRNRAVRTLRALCEAMYARTSLHPTLDVGLVALTRALQLVPDSALALFACGRLAGWIAHILEQHERGHLLRPRARYVGPSAADDLG